MPLNEAARAITRHREQLGWSKRRLSRESSVSAPYIVQLENGTRDANPHILVQLADAMGIHPYVLLGEAGFIPPDHIAEAEAKAAEAMKDPAMVAQARDDDTGGAFAWLVADYLNLLGDDAFASGVVEFGPGANIVDWTTYAPERMAEAERNPRSEPIRRIFSAAHVISTSPKPTPIEGWNELTDVDQRLVQQLVNRLRRQEPAE